MPLGARVIELMSKMLWHKIWGDRDVVTLEKTWLVSGNSHYSVPDIGAM